MYLYPNPNNGKFTLHFNKEIAAGKISVTNQLGSELFQLETNASNHIELSLANYLKRSAYYLFWNNSNFAINKKFVVY